MYDGKFKFGVVVFPGSNCDHDVYYVLSEIFSQDVRFIWHKDESVGDVDVVILPGGIFIRGLFKGWGYCEVFTRDEGCH
jgi:phosphoribosylformylglycinamidine (FGAM) synthase-like amidotransferase family enzyme